MKRYYADYHLHSKFSFDSKESIENICIRSKEMGLNEICLTEHFSMNEVNVSYGFLDFDKYIEEINKFNTFSKNNIKIKVGLEIGEGHLRIKEINDYLEGKNVDFIIGSLHRINDIGIIQHIEKQDINKVYEDYFMELYKLADIGEYDVLGHLDLVQRYSWSKYAKYKYNNYSDLIDLILRKVIERGKGIEVNTSIMKLHNEFMPKIEIIKRYKELGGEIITVGSDAHKCDRVGEGISVTYELLRDAGFKYITRYDNRNCIFEVNS